MHWFYSTLRTPEYTVLLDKVPVCACVKMLKGLKGYGEFKLNGDDKYGVCLGLDAALTCLNFCFSPLK